jgi:hypothetical protein
MKQDKILDSYLSEKVEEYQAPFKEAQWQHALAQLEEDEKRKPIAWFKGLATLLGILIIGGLAYLWANKGSGEQKITAIQSSKAEVQTSANAPADKPQVNEQAAITQNTLQKENSTTNIEPQQADKPSFYSSTNKVQAKRKKQELKNISETIINDKAIDAPTENVNLSQAEDAIIENTQNTTAPLALSKAKQSKKLLEAKNSTASINTKNNEISTKDNQHTKQNNGIAKTKSIEAIKPASEQKNTQAKNNLVDIKTKQLESVAKNINSNAIASNNESKTIDTKADKNKKQETLVAQNKNNDKANSDDIQVPSIAPKQAELPAAKSIAKNNLNENAQNSAAKTENKNTTEEAVTSNKKLSLSWLLHPYVDIAVSASKAPEAPINVAKYDKLRSYSPWLGIGWQANISSKFFIDFGASASATNNLSYQMLRNRSGGSTGTPNDTSNYTFQHKSLAQLFVPIQIGYTINNKHSVMLGGTISTPLGLRVSEKDYGTTSFTNSWQSNSAYAAMQAFANISYQCKVLRNLYAYATYMQGLSDMTNQSFTGSTVVDRNSRVNVGVKVKF